MGRERHGQRGKAGRQSEWRMWGLSSLNFTAINLNPATFFRRCFLFLFVFYSRVASSGAEWTHLNHTDRLSVELNGHLSSGKGGRQAVGPHPLGVTYYAKRRFAKRGKPQSARSFHVHSHSHFHFLVRSAFE